MAESFRLEDRFERRGISTPTTLADFPEVQRLKQLGHFLRFEHGCFGYQGVTIS